MARTTQERKRAQSKVEDLGGEARGEKDQDQSDEQSREGGGSGGGVFGELKDVAADAALAVLAPVAKQAVTKAAKYAVKKGPELLDDTVMPMLEEAGGPKELVGKLMSGDGEGGGLLSKLTPGGGDDGGSDAGDGTGKGRRMPIQQSVDVAAPLEVVYDQWTQFEDYPKFMHRVQRVEQREDARVAFHTKVWGINRMWEAEIVEQRPDERIVFKSVNGVQLTGVVTFHDLAERLTRIELNIDLDPDGPVEKIARGARFVKRATRGDLKRFKAYVEMHEDETGAWRGEIQDGDVVSQPDDEGYEDEYDEDEEPEAEADTDADAEYEEYEYEDESEDEDEPEAREEPEEEKKPKRKAAASSRRRGSSNGGDPKGSGSTSRSKARGKKASSSSSRSSSSSGRKTSQRKSSSRGKSSSRSRS